MFQKARNNLIFFGGAKKDENDKYVTSESLRVVIILEKHTALESLQEVLKERNIDAEDFLLITVRFQTFFRFGYIYCILIVVL